MCRDGKCGRSPDLPIRRLPFGILRVISDLADGTAPESYDRFERASADLSAAVILGLKITRAQAGIM